MLDVIERHENINSNTNNTSNSVSDNNLLSENISNVGIKLAKLKKTNRSSELGNQIKTIKTKIKKVKNPLNEYDESDIVISNDANFKSDINEFDSDEKMIDDDLKLFQTTRSKTMSHIVSPSKKTKINSMPQQNGNSDRLKMAREEAERAIKQKKIFTIIGPYPALRDALKSRGWVEKFENMNTIPTIKKKKSKKNSPSNEQNDDDKDADDCNNADDNLDVDDEGEDEDDKVKPWEENNGYYGILSRLVKNFNPYFIWTVRSGNIDYSYLNKDQMVNHFNKNGAFTTKIGLCTNLRNLSWFSPQTSDDFFPRCYKLSQEEDKYAFIDDYRLTCCIGLLKYLLIKHRGEPDEDFLDVHITSSEELKKMKDEAKKNDNELNLEIIKPENQMINEPVKSLNVPSRSNTKRKSIVKQMTQVPIEAIEFAIQQLRDYVDFNENNDIDKPTQTALSEDKWLKLYEWFYAACHDKVPFERFSESLVEEVIRTLDSIKPYCPQYDIDGYRNIWIVKPGALSRGRGIIVFDKIENILELNTSPLQRDGKYVVQKYIERPLLIHKIKFDIRQWFLVTDFNPLTIWMYKDCYLRFCTAEFTLDTTQQSVHLCNYSIQKNYKNDADRSDELPHENMWTSSEFIDKYLKKRNQTHAWDDIIYPGMKNAIISSMQATQDIIETRKNTFELYGADFMIGEDLKPWLIEINCSPTMARSTAVATLLCDSVLEDVCKVIIDRKSNKNCDTGRFELIHKAMTVPQPNYIGIDLKVDGQSYKKAHQSLNTTNTQNNQINNNLSQSFSNNNNSQQIKRPKSTEQPHSPVSSIIEIKSNRNSNTTATTTTNNNNSQSTNNLKIKKESTLPTISIVTSIHELAQKERQNMSHLSSYKSNVSLSDISENKSKTDSNQIELSSSFNIRRKTNEDKYSTLRPLNLTNKSIQFQSSLNTNIIRPHPFSDLNTQNNQIKELDNKENTLNKNEQQIQLRNTLHIKKYKPNSVKQLIKLNKIQASDLSTIEFENDEANDFLNLNSNEFNLTNTNSLNNYNINNSSSTIKGFIKSPKLVILNLKKNRAPSSKINEAKIGNSSSFDNCTKKKPIRQSLVSSIKISNEKEIELISEKIHLTKNVIHSNDFKATSEFMLNESYGDKSFNSKKNEPITAKLNSENNNKKINNNIVYKKDSRNGRYSRAFLADDIPKLLKKYSVP
ncbi:unnamed protein product [Brachionus calyciflorus]|uniref:Uncharacterized protein n=1 Tax=Brachionus calyciflorus TaxID=104777 RepID=A0A813Y1B1_9BILA|nr:unnamed protein product [Brachionus calyciflorus]